MDIPCKIEKVINSIQNTPSQFTNPKEDVRLIAVTKTQGIEAIKEAVDYGLRDLGENRVQEIVEKYPHFPADVRWHLIGHLQTNKVKYIADKVYMIHSLDSIRLAEEIQKQAAKINRVMPCLVQLNIADEDSKFGLKKEEAEDFLREICRFPNIEINGLMTIGPYVDDIEKIRNVFRELRQLKEYLATLALPGVKMRELSMGMSNDYTVAIEEGATMVRVGTSIFGIRHK
ncbi:MAG: YggS family pyridoxal phosphate-dependent enzyme [Bacillota bacterium]|nr:YggS family pyridoxal phosphate-dependent enzyme [Bacillota bacterium]